MAAHRPRRAGPRPPPTTTFTRYGPVAAPSGARTILYGTQEWLSAIDKMARQAHGVLRRGAPWRIVCAHA